MQRSLGLYDSVSKLTGIGTSRLEALRQRGIETISDLLYTFPFRYEERTPQRDVAALPHGERVTVEAEVEGALIVRYVRGKALVRAPILIGGAPAAATWFNQPYLKNRIRPGMRLLLTGKWDAVRHAITVAEFEPAETSENATGWVPIYRTTTGISQKFWRHVIQQALQAVAAPWGIPEILPLSLCQKYRLLDRGQALLWMHFPTDLEAYKQARRRMAFEELFTFEVAMLLWRAEQRVEIRRAPAPIGEALIQRFTQALPFALTAAQKRVLDEIATDMGGIRPMQRLLEGDVGSGKTVLALFALYVAAQRGQQGALMAPTALLARQHYLNWQPVLAKLGVPAVLLTGQTPPRERAVVLRGLADGDLEVAFGTHALLEEDVCFHQLGVVVIDEQHRFGVRQRERLEEKGEAPDVLLLSATPIPRTLAHVLYDDLEVSILDERPPGRAPLQTTLLKSRQLHQAWERADRAVRDGEQVYVICPAVFDSEGREEIANVEKWHRHLTTHYREWRVGMLYGEMPAKEKEATMAAFVDHQLDVLVASTVVEVGVDVAAATVMILLDAERFGLAELHQLRGRVGRGTRPSVCFAVSDATTQEAKQRLSVFATTENGFELAEKDMALRGPGELFGVRQSGLPEFQVADLTSDRAMLEVAAQEAHALQEEGLLSSDDFASLRSFVQQSRSPVFVA